MHKMNGDKAQVLTDSSKLGQLDAETLSVVPEELGGASLAAALGAHCICHSFLKTDTEHCFHFSPFFTKAKILFRFLLITEIRY